MAAKFQHPFQRIQYLEAQVPAQRLLIAGAGPRIYSYTADTGRRLSVWPQDQETANGQNSRTTGESADTDGQEPPGKKRKVSPSSEGIEDSKPNAQETGKPGASLAWSSIPLLVASPTGSHIVAVTAEDKCVRVFEVSRDATLQQLSERCMPKRPSVISLTPDGNTILCGDKFGDLYSLPLIPSGKPVVQAESLAPAKPYQPAATNLTVHTKRNLASLEQQLRMASKSSEEKPGPTFEHKLLLGHVSMLTGLAYVSLPSGSSSGTRSYVLTADRDEHIRVSRGLPQTHVIENYCLGHTSLISQLCIPQWQPEVLISGGGDDFLLVWNWHESRILQKVPLLDQISEPREITVQGIWAIPLSVSEGTANLIFVAIEGSSQLLCYVMGYNGQIRLQQSVQLPGNVLDMTYSGKGDVVLVSVDDVHECGSTQAWRENPTSPRVLLQALRVTGRQDSLTFETAEDAMTNNVNAEGTSDIITSTDENTMAKSRKDISEALYNVGNLRKRAQAEEE